MGKLPIILSGGETPDDARAISKEERSAATVAVVGDAVARSGAIADRFSIDRHPNIALREKCCGNSGTGGADGPAEVAIDVDAAAKPIVTTATRIGDPARRKRRDAGAIARSRGHTWRESEAVQETETDLSGSTWSYVIGNDRGRNCAVIDALATSDAEQRNRIAGCDRDVTIAAIASFSARRVRIRDRVTRSNLIGRSERRNRQHGDASPICNRPIGTSTDSTEMEKVLCYTTVDSITSLGQNRSSVSPITDTTNISSGGIKNARTSTHADVHSKSAITLEVREPIGSDVNIVYEGINRDARNHVMQRFTDDPVLSRPSEPIVRLIGIADFARAERSLLPAEQVDVNGSSSFSQLSAKIDPSGSRWTKMDYTWRPSPRICFGLRTLLLGLLAMCLLCDMVLAAPSSSSSSLSSTLGHLQTMETFEYGIEEEELVMSRNKLGEDELEIIRKSIVQGLGLQRIPDPSKANVSQAEYERAHREYLKRVQLSHNGQETRVRRDLHVFRTAEHPGNRSSFDFSWSANGNHRHSLYFPVAVPHDVAEDVTVDHATLRFLLRGDHRRPRDLEVLVYLRMPTSRRLLARRSISRSSIDPIDSRWLELDTTEAAVSWLERDLENSGLELEFLQDGRPAQRDVGHASLNVFTVSERSIGGRRKRSTPEELMPLHKGRRSKCKGDNNKKCCRHELTVMFKDLKGFDFIVYPKGFDAGYCKGRCPPRYNPAHHHALLQSLLWKEDRKRVPKPCCAPSKLEQLMILYFDENDSTQLKVSYWKNIQVLECACS